MSNYISKNIAILAVIENCNKYLFADDAMLETIADIEKESADVVEVVHAKNISDAHPSDEFECSNCGLILRDYCEYVPEDDIHYEFTDWNCCPRCSARMDGGEDQ